MNTSSTALFALLITASCTGDPATGTPTGTPPGTPTGTPAGTPAAQIDHAAGGVMQSVLNGASGHTSTVDTSRASSGGAPAIGGSPSLPSAGAPDRPGEGGVSPTLCGGTPVTVADAEVNTHALTGWSSPTTSGGVDRVGDCGPGALAKSLPGTGLSYCVKASARCSNAPSNCPLYVSINLGGTRSYFDRVDDSAANGELIAVVLDSLADGNDVKDAFAEMPRVIAHDYAGLDRRRVYAVGFSAGSGAITRALCHLGKGADGSKYGSTSDIYTALAFGGAPCGCTIGFQPPAGAGSVDILSVTGDKDEFNQGDGGERTLRNRAFVNGCEQLGNVWRGVAPDDHYVLGQDGSCQAVKKLSFGVCKAGDVVGYEFVNWPHDSRYPGNQFEDIAWRFFQNRTKR